MIDVAAVLAELGIGAEQSGVAAGAFQETATGETLTAINPTTGAPIARATGASAADHETVVARAAEAFAVWRTWPAPKRGELVRQIGNALRAHKAALGALVTLEMGKIVAEGEGEVQEMIDICDFATGLSRQLYGLTIASERPNHRMFEQWHPLGVVGVVTAFNFPVAVWAWNAALAAVCGNAVVWKPHPATPLTAIATHRIAERVCEANDVPAGLFGLLCGGADTGVRLVEDRRVALLSFTGSIPVGKRVAAARAPFLGRTLLELGGNNAIVVLDDADLELAVRAIVFGAVGTAGQRCTTTRRLLVHKRIAKALTERLVRAYRQVRIGDPLDPQTLMGPLIDGAAVDAMEAALETVKAQGGEIVAGGATRLPKSVVGVEGPNFVEPTVVRIQAGAPITCQETFAPILYVSEVEDLDQAIRIHNAVPQGLSSAIFTNSVRAAEQFLSARGSDCGIANVNIGTSGAEIGGAFGGEKETGGGRESGSDAWRAYMRRQTCTVNYGTELPLAQGLTFGDAGRVTPAE